MSIPVHAAARSAVQGQSLQLQCEKLQAEIFDLRRKLESVVEQNIKVEKFNQIKQNEAFVSGRKRGHEDVISEIEDLWHSQNFYLGLLYGNLGIFHLFVFCGALRL